nr:type II toxin-antitoxin system prevent-host-death family antitoxin [Massilia glaciei]
MEIDFWFDFASTYSYRARCAPSAGALSWRRLDLGTVADYDGPSRSGAAMRTVNIHEAKTNFSKLVDAAASGEEIIIAKAGKPAARLGSDRKAKNHAAFW